MKNILYFIKYGAFFLFIISCKNDDPPPENKALSVTITASSDEIILGNPVEISINVANADSLFAVAFALNFNPDIFQIGSSGDTLTMGNLFEEPFPGDPTVYSSHGEISIGFGEWGNIKETASGTACTIILSTIDIGNGSFYLSSIDLIQKNTSEITGYPPIIESKEVLVEE